MNEIIRFLMIYEGDSYFQAKTKYDDYVDRQYITFEQFVCDCYDGKPTSTLVFPVAEPALVAVEGGKLSNKSRKSRTCMSCQGDGLEFPTGEPCPKCDNGEVMT